MSNAQFSMFNAQYSIFNVQYSIVNAQCSKPEPIIIAIKVQVSDTRMMISITNACYIKKLSKEHELIFCNVHALSEITNQKSPIRNHKSHHRLY